MKYNKYYFIILIILLHYIWKSINPVSKKYKYNFDDIYLYKSDILNRIPKQFKLDVIIITSPEQLKNIKYPIIFKLFR